ncbi:hypothetical protein H112_01815 [Trichophyton rubrum D6]|uniref:Uncharacterized protein n=4 Tax=Trichophyton TaxID=5550 RepID=A0A178EYL4_TRIRU|nr:uncharacterized protein TERG_06585 [Trichophyton rubrum CBS 118892]EZF26010.1 hypothetical protein H100_01811 [Trichophyton rubrum MR850]EZF44975.1 hypothetical protein H102_01806 [Trichophyton rubrum CBS 100081]EZF55659.1 hypothetical protein H103_01816 [Trichophyton rubrum CBS 288.86]EZF66242.1 hypothetical protein H104_01793 [Trichophyton rubrum CBS 289.86]EZF76871.1 hypothetical protein H105_01820 [Trichophyton soudanense CBS 452.61]EZF87641.1 hypothetical protein H110_01817 [Trichophy
MKFFAALFLIPFLGGALAAPSPSEMIAEAPMQENSDMDASSQLLQSPAVQGPAAPVALPTAEAMATATAVDKLYLQMLMHGASLGQVGSLR